MYIKLPLTDKGVSLCLHCGTMWFMLHIYFPSGSLEFWYSLGRGCRHHHSLIETLALSLQQSSLGTNVIHRLLHFHCLGKMVLCAASHGRKKAYRSLMWIPPDSTYVFVPYDSAVYPYHISVLNLNRVHNYMLSLMNSSSKCMRVVLGTHDALFYFNMLLLVYSN